MLHGSVAFIVLVVCAIVGAEIQRGLALRGWRAPTMEGLSFLIAGMLLGGSGLGLFPGDILATLRVVVLFGLAWIGLVFGVQMDLRAIRRISTRLRSIGVLAPTAAAGLVSLSAAAAGLPWSLALATAAIAVASSPTLLEKTVQGRNLAAVGAIRVLRLLLAFTGVPAVAAMAVATSLASPLVKAPGAVMGGGEMLALVVAIGAVVGYVLVVLVRGVGERIELLTLTIGGMCVLAGATAAAGVAALPAAACCGAVVVNRMVFPHRVLRAVHSLERPMLVALLVLVGASWQGASFSWTVFFLMTAVRALVLVVVGSGVVVLAGGTVSDRLPRLLGLGLLPQGELALGLLVAVITFLPHAPGYLEAVVAAVIANNLLAGRWFATRLPSTAETSERA